MINKIKYSFLDNKTPKIYKFTDFVINNFGRDPAHIVNITYYESLSF